MHPTPFQSRIESITSTRTKLPSGPRTIWMSLCLATAFALLVPISAVADTVSGRIYGQDEKPVPNATFTAKPARGEAVEFKTNASGAFSVYLDPGRYTISPSADASLQGVIDSYPQPVQQDVHMKKGGR